MTDIQDALDPTTAHSAYVLNEGFESSFTVPMVAPGGLPGVHLLRLAQARHVHARTCSASSLLYASLITMAIANELIAIRSIVGTVQHRPRLHRVPRPRDRRAPRAHVAVRPHHHEEARRDAGPDDEFVEHVYLYAPLHDIGKIGIPDRILLKPGKLDAGGVGDHEDPHDPGPRDGRGDHARTCTSTTFRTTRCCCNIVEFHHEAMNGSGYPHGLSGEDIPLESRIVAVADVFDALTSPRPYKREWSVNEAILRTAAHGRDRQAGPDVREGARDRAPGGRGRPGPSPRGARRQFLERERTHGSPAVEPFNALQGHQGKRGTDP